MTTHTPAQGRQHRPKAKTSHWRGKRTKTAWQKSPTTPSDRKGSGVHYGSLDLSPQNTYVMKEKDNQNHQLRIAVLGGNEEVGKNMTMIEYGDDIILIDMGIQFAEEAMRGVDGIVPDISYLQGREKNVRGVIITHMHMDHIGGIPYLMPQLPGVPVFSAPITLAMIAKKLEYTPDITVDLRSVDDQTVLRLGNFTVTFFGVSHSVPSALAIVIDTPCGKIVHTGDFKVDLEPQTQEENVMLERLTRLGNENIIALLSDSTNAYQMGNQTMEREVIHDLENIFTSAKGRLFFGMISTNVVRLGQILSLAEKHGRYVAIGGTSLKTTYEIGQQLGYITTQPQTIIDIADIAQFPPQKIMGIFPGAQGEKNGAFFKLANNDMKNVRVHSGDTVVFSSSVIPGNERSVQFITDKFYRLGAKVVNYRMLNIHAGGHAKAADLGVVVQLVKPRYLVPIEGHHAFLHHHADAAKAVGFRADHILIADNGQVMEFEKSGNGKLTKEKIISNLVFVDEKTIGEVDEDTLIERKNLGDDGIIMINGKIMPSRLQITKIHSVGFQKKSTRNTLHARINAFITREYQRLPKNIPADRITQTLEQKLRRVIEEYYGMHPLIAFTLIIE